MNTLKRPLASLDEHSDIHTPAAFLHVNQIKNWPKRQIEINFNLRRIPEKNNNFFFLN